MQRLVPFVGNPQAVNMLPGVAMPVIWNPSILGKISSPNRRLYQSIRVQNSKRGKKKKRNQRAITATAKIKNFFCIYHHQSILIFGQLHHQNYHHKS